VDSWVPWATTINAVAFVIYLINEFRNGRFARSRATKVDTNSIYDEYWLRNICFPVCVTPLIHLGHQLSDAIDECSSISDKQKLNEHFDQLSVDLYRQKNAIMSSSSILTIFDQNHPQFFSDGFDEVEEALSEFINSYPDKIDEDQSELIYNTQVGVWKGVRNIIRLTIQSHIKEEVPEYLAPKKRFSWF